MGHRSAAGRGGTAGAALALACLLGVAAPAPGADSLSAAVPPAASPPPAALAAVHGVGVDVVPAALLGGGTRGYQPTGTALVATMEREHVQLVRLAWGDQSPQKFAGGGWKVVFDRLAAAHIDALLTLHQQPPGHSQGPGVSNATITDLGALVGAEEGLLSEIRAQCGGAYPPNLVALDVFNEPVLNPETVGSLRQLAGTVRAFTGGIPVTIGGWRSAGPTTPAAFNNPDLAGLASTVGDFVSVHLYPDNQPGASLSTTSVAALEPVVRSLLSAALSAVAAAGHAGMPVLITETGAQNGQAPGGGFHRDVSGSPAHQRATIAAVLDVASAFAPRGVRGVQVWWLTPPLTEACNGSALICFDGRYTSPALPLLAAHQFS